MKKRLLIAFISLFAVGTSFAQKTFTFGPKFGYATTSLKTERHSTTTYLIGVQTDYKILKDLSISVDLYHAKYNILERETYEYSKHDYLNLPLFLRYYPTDGLSIQVGPEFGYIINSDIFKGGYTSLMGGIGYKFNFGLSIDGRFSQGFTNISNVEKFYSSIYSISVGYFF